MALRRTLMIGAGLVAGLPGCQDRCDDHWVVSEIPAGVRGVVRGVLYGDDGLLLSSVGNGDLEVRPTRTTEHLRAVNDDGQEAPLVVVGDRGTIRVSNDSGGMFSVGSLPDPAEALLAVSVSCADLRAGVAVGEDGIVVHTDDLAVWRRVESGVTARLMGVSYVSATQILIVGAGGTVRTTSDAGSTWSSRDLGTTEDVVLLSMGTCRSGVRPNAGLVATATGAVFLTEDAGVSWRRVMPDVPEAPVGLHFEAIYDQPVEELVVDALTRHALWRYDPAEGWIERQGFEEAAQSLSADTRVVTQGALHTYVPRSQCYVD